MVTCLECGTSGVYTIQLMPLPLYRLMFHENREWVAFLVPTSAGCLGKEGVNQVLVSIYGYWHKVTVSTHTGVVDE